MNKTYQEALKALNNHQVIAFPTETVFGLGVFYDDEKAYNLLNKIKRRKENKPYTMMVSSVEELFEFAEIDDKYLPIIKKHMPGSLTILVKSNSRVPAYVTHNTGIIGMRVPANKDALDLLNYLKKPLLVPSANRADEKPAMDDQEVKQIFKDEIAVVIPGKSSSGEPSTIIDLTGEEIKLIRKGPIPFEELSQLIS